MAIVFALTSVVFTFLGGLLALQSRKRLHLLLGLSGGLLLGLVSFDLIPEVLEMSAAEVGHTPGVMIAFVGGFLALHAIERWSHAHEIADSENGKSTSHTHNSSGVLAALLMAGHVFLDGIGIGLAFQVSKELGFVVAFALITHAFTDGLNTVSFLTRTGSWKRTSLWLLGVDAVARISGAYLGSQVSFDDGFIAMYLAVFAGFLTYVATTHILPAAHQEKTSRLTLLMTLAGAIVMLILVNLLHG